jgi:hypothetical protein
MFPMMPEVGKQRQEDLLKQATAWRRAKLAKETSAQSGSRLAHFVIALISAAFRLGR